MFVGSAYPKKSDAIVWIFTGPTVAGIIVSEKLRPSLSCKTALINSIILAFALRFAPSTHGWGTCLNPAWYTPLTQGSSWAWKMSEILSISKEEMTRRLSRKKDGHGTIRNAVHRYAMLQTSLSMRYNMLQTSLSMRYNML
jgi:hypothetical protein